MERNLDLRIEIDADGNYKVVSAEPESGMQIIVATGKVTWQDDPEFNEKIGNEVMSWLRIWADELEESGK